MSMEDTGSGGISVKFKDVFHHRDIMPFGKDLSRILGEEYYWKRLNKLIFVGRLISTKPGDEEENEK